MFDITTNHKDQPLFCHLGLGIYICAILVVIKITCLYVCICVGIYIYIYMCVCVLCSGPGLRSGFPGMCSHWHPVHRFDARSWFLLGVLSLLRQLWREDVPEADVRHSLSQKNPLLERIHHHSHYPVSVCVCALLCIFKQHNDVLSEISIERKCTPHCLCASPLD